MGARARGGGKGRWTTSAPLRQRCRTCSSVHLPELSSRVWPAPCLQCSTLDNKTKPNKRRSLAGAIATSPVAPRCTSCNTGAPLQACSGLHAALVCLRNAA